MSLIESHRLEDRLEFDLIYWDGLCQFSDFGIDVAYDNSRIIASPISSSSLMDWLSKQKLKDPSRLILPEDVARPFVAKDFTAMHKRLLDTRDKCQSMLEEHCSDIDMIPIRVSPVGCLNAGCVPNGDNTFSVIINDGVQYSSLINGERRSVIEHHPIGFHSLLDLLSESDRFKEFSQVDILRFFGDAIKFPTHEEFCVEVRSFVRRVCALADLSYDFEISVLRRSELFKHGNRMYFGSIEAEDAIDGAVASEVIEPFVLMHEFAHGVLGHLQRISCIRSSSSKINSKDTINTYHDCEFEADEFALRALLDLHRDDPDQGYATICGGLIMLFSMHYYSAKYTDLFGIPEVPEKLSNQSRLQFLPIFPQKHPTPSSRLYRLIKQLNMLVPERTPKMTLEELSKEDQIFVMASGRMSEFIEVTHYDPQSIIQDLEAFFLILNDGLKWLGLRNLKENMSRKE